MNPTAPNRRKLTCDECDAECIVTWRDEDSGEPMYCPFCGTATVNEPDETER